MNDFQMYEEGRKEAQAKQRIKSTCNKCRASEFHNECSLGYYCYNYTPKEPCPKPLTIQQLINQSKINH